MRSHCVLVGDRCFFTFRGWAAMDFAAVSLSFPIPASKTLFLWLLLSIVVFVTFLVCVCMFTPTAALKYTGGCESTSCTGGAVVADAASTSMICVRMVV